MHSEFIVWAKTFLRQVDPGSWQRTLTHSAFSHGDFDEKNRSWSWNPPIRSCSALLALPYHEAFYQGTHFETVDESEGYDGRSKQPAWERLLQMFKVLETALECTNMHGSRRDLLWRDHCSSEWNLMQYYLWAVLLFNFQTSYIGYCLTTLKVQKTTPPLITQQTP